MAAECWRRFGGVANYVEPFFGSGALLLRRPNPRGIETVNDINGWLTNFWRAVRKEPDAVAHFADWPVSELDLHARGDWLFYRNGIAGWIERIRSDPEYYDVKSAGWWVWGQCCWIAGGWGVNRKLPHLSNAGQGVNRQLPHLGDAGRGVNRKRPHLGDAGQGLREYMQDLSVRLRNVRICCGDWTRVCGECVTTNHGVTAVFLDPPYGVEDRRQDLYGADDSVSISAKVREWCIENQSDPQMRIALCGYDTEHKMPGCWSMLRWKSTGGYSSSANGNRTRERIWFSPYCLNEKLLFEKD